MKAIKRFFKRPIGIFVIVLLACVLLGSLTSGFTKFGLSDIKDKLDKERNPNNLITLASVSLTEGKRSTSDIKVKVNEDKIVTLSGRASADESITYASVTLTAGTYMFTGAEGGSNKTYTLNLVSGENVYRSDSGSPLTLTAGTYSVVIKVYEDATFLNTKIKPVLVSGSVKGDFYVD